MPFFNGVFYQQMQTPPQAAANKLTLFREDMRSGTTNPIGSFSRESGKRVRRYWIPWSYRQQARLDFIGYSTVKQRPGGINYISRSNPYADQDELQNQATGMVQNYMYAEAILSEEGFISDPRFSGTGFAQTAVGTSQFNEALITVQFGSPTWGIVEDDNVLVNAGESSLVRNCIIDFQPSGKQQTLPPMAAVIWTDTRQSISSHTAIMLCEADYTVKWLDVPIQALPTNYLYGVPPFNAYLASPAAGLPFRGGVCGLIGGCNSLPFGLAGQPGGVIPAGCAVMLFPRIGPPHRMANGGFAYDIEYKFKIYPNGANKAYRYQGFVGVGPGRGNAGWTPFQLSAPGPNGTPYVFPPVDFRLAFYPQSL